MNAALKRRSELLTQSNINQSIGFRLSASAVNRMGRPFRIEVSAAALTGAVSLGGARHTRYLNSHSAEIRVFAIKASFGRLIGMLEPVIADHGRFSPGGRNITLEAAGALDLSGHPRSGTAGNRQAKIVTAKGKFGDQAWLPNYRIRINTVLKLRRVAIPVFLKQPIMGYWELLPPLIGLVAVGSGWPNTRDNNARLRLISIQALRWATF